MDNPIISPYGMVKKLVGESLTITIKLNPHFKYFLELITNLNRTTDSYPFDGEDDQYTCTIKLTKSGFYHYRIRYRREGTKTWRFIKNHSSSIYSNFVQVDPSWLNQAIVYNVFVRFFHSPINNRHPAGLSPTGGGTFDDVKAYLDILTQMKVNVLYFNPIHLIGELYRKHNLLDQLPTYWQPGSPYSIKDYKSIDPELTYDKDTKKHLLSDPQQEFKDLINAAHERNMVVIMDLVFNHTAHDFVFQRLRPEWYLYKQNITSLSDPYLYPNDIQRGLPWGDARHTFSPYDHGVWFEDAAQLNWEYRLPESVNKPPPNPSIKEMWEYFISIPKYWIKHFGIDGFRCDVAYRLPPKFWTACIAESREEAQLLKTNLAKDVVFFAESYTDDLNELQTCGFSAVYGDYSNKLSSPLELTGYLKYLYNYHHQFFPSGSKWLIFPEGHDFSRNPQKILGQNYSNTQAAFLANQSRWLLTATLPGIPLIFNGFEQIEQYPVNLFGYGVIDWQKDPDLKSFIAKINLIRNQYPAFSLVGNIELLESNQGLNTQTQLMAYLRTYHHQHNLVIVNMDIYNQAGPAEIYLPPNFQGVYQLTDLLTHKTYLRHGQKLTVILDPGKGHLFMVKFL